MIRRRRRRDMRRRMQNVSDEDNTDNSIGITMGQLEIYIFNQTTEGEEHNNQTIKKKIKHRKEEL